MQTISHMEQVLASFLSVKSQIVNTLSFASRFCLLLFARADVTKYHRLGGTNNRNLLSHNSGA